MSEWIFSTTGKDCFNLEITVCSEKIYHCHKLGMHQQTNTQFRMEGCRRDSSVGPLVLPQRKDNLMTIRILAGLCLSVSLKTGCSIN